MGIGGRMVINNKRYNTNAAELMAEANDELLYRKRTGEYFLFNFENNQILPLSYDDAVYWGKTNLSQSKVDDIFFKPEIENKKNITISLSGAAIKMLNTLAAKERISKSQVVENLILKKEP